MQARLNIWDTAGSEAYRTVTNTYYRDADCACLVYDSTSAQSFQALEDYWLEQVVEKCGPDTLMFIVANKCDRVD